MLTHKFTYLLEKMNINWYAISACAYLQFILWNMQIHATYLPTFFWVVPLALGQSYDSCGIVLETVIKNWYALMHRFNLRNGSHFASVCVWD